MTGGDSGPEPSGGATGEREPGGTADSETGDHGPRSKAEPDGGKDSRDDTTGETETDRAGPHNSGEQEPDGGKDSNVRAAGCGVVIVTGLGDTRWTWRQVETGLGGYGPVIVADRPRHDSLPSLAGETAKLREFVVGHGLERPVLVAHSFGAFIAEAYARRWPVAGLVLVDPSWDPAARPRGGVGRAVAAALFRTAVAGGRLLDATGLARALGPVAWRVSMRAMALRRPSAGVVAAATSVYRRGETLAAAAAEELAFRDVAAAVVASRTSGSVVEVPVVVLTAVGVSAETSDSRHWIAVHRRLAALFPLGRQEIVRGAGHMVHVDRPEVIVRQVHRCLSG